MRKRKHLTREELDILEIAAAYKLCSKCRMTALGVLRAAGWARALAFVERNQGR